MARDSEWNPGQDVAGPSDPQSPARREALLTIGRVTAASIIAAVAPRMVFGQGLPPDGQIPWAEVVGVARQAISMGVDQWAIGARVEGGQVNGSAVFLPPGSLIGEPAFDIAVENALLALPAPPQVAAAFAGVAWEVWDAWSRSYHLSLHKALPAFAAVPGPQAGPEPLDPVKLRKGRAQGAVGIESGVVAEALLSLLGDLAAGEEASVQIAGFARWYSKAFRRWFGGATLVNVLAMGQVPSFAPPYVPVGPVVMGDVIGKAVLEVGLFG